jgi:hypothetical protein
MSGRAVLVTLAAVMLTGCGVGDDREQARIVVAQFYDAVGAGRGAEACAQLSDPLEEQIEKDAGEPCASAITSTAGGPAEPGAAVVFATNAHVETSGGNSVFLSREADGWRLSAFGCKPEEGKPRDRPLDCEAEA